MSRGAAHLIVPNDGCERELRVPRLALHSTYAQLPRDVCLCERLVRTGCTYEEALDVWLLDEGLVRTKSGVCAAKRRVVLNSIV